MKMKIIWLVLVTLLLSLFLISCGVPEIKEDVYINKNMVSLLISGVNSGEYVKENKLEYMKNKGLQSKFEKMLKDYRPNKDDNSLSWACGNLVLLK